MRTKNFLDMQFDNMATYNSLEDMLVSALDMIKPPEKLSVSQAAAKYRYLYNPGSYIGYWANKKTPYLVEPMDELQSMEFTGMIFAGPARTGKSDMLFNWITHTALCDPADMIVYHMTEAVGREWSKGDLAKMLRHSKLVAECLIPGRQNDNVHDKYFKSGMKLLIKWPSITELSGKTIPRVWLQDYDRMDDDIEKEGPPFDLARKRTESFKRFGMTVAESSPGREVLDAKWIAKTPNEAPPTKGILQLYNRGDRRRWNWRCPFCKETFEPDFNLLNYPASEDLWEASEQVTLRCPQCQLDIEPSFKDELNQGGRWVKEGMLWLPDGTMAGKPVRTDIASFWLKGPAAVFQDWSKIVYSYLQAKEAFEANGDEGPLKKTVNTDQGHPYTPMAIQSSRLPEELKARRENWGSSKELPTVPAGVRFLVATIDVQIKSFVVQVHGVGEGGDIWFIDMFKIRKSDRIDEDGERCQISPGGYAEDWHLLIDKVIERSYPLADESGRSMSMKAIGCDWGGEAGVSVNAMRFWRYLRHDHDGGHHKRFHLVKGEHSKSAPRVRQVYPDAGQKDSLTAARGDVPVIFMNSTRLKDQMAARLECIEPGAGMIHFPHWTEDFIYTQLTTEVRNEKWENPRRHRNEAWDLLYYCLALGVERSVGINVEKPGFWDNPPGWAKEWDDNDLVFDPIVIDRPFERKKVDYKAKLAELGRALT